MKIESSEFEHGRVYFKQFGAERVKTDLYFAAVANARIDLMTAYYNYVVSD